MEVKKRKENKSWSIAGIWNNQLTFGREKRELKPRTHIWASELGKNYYERYLKMTAVKPDFDFDVRTLRKFEAGNFFERIIGFVLISAGILKEDNKWYEILDTEDTVRITGRPDFVAGGKPDWEKARKVISEEMLYKLMPNLCRIAEALVEQFSKDYPDGLTDLVYEIKSINSLVFWSKKDYLQEAYPHHRLQCFWEMKVTKLPEGRIAYISKDDLTIAEFPVYANDQKLIDLYEADIKAMSHFIRNKKTPPRPEGLIFDKRKKLSFQYNKVKYKLIGCYVPNWQVEWSNYISKMTGIKGKTKEEVVMKWKNSLKAEKKRLNEELKDKFKIKIDSGELEK